LEKSWQIKNTWVLIPSPSYFLLIWRTKYIMNSNPRSVILSARGNGLALLISYPAMTYFSFFPAKTSLISTPFPTLASQIGRQTQLRSMVIYSMGTRFCQTSSQCGRIGRFLWNKIIMSSAHQIAVNLKITRVFISLFSWIMLLTQYLSRPS